MKNLSLVLLVFFIIPFTAHAQQTDTLIHKLDSLSLKTDSAGGQVNNIKPKAYNDVTRITFPGYFALIGSDFEQQFTAPFHLTKHDALRTAEYGVSIAALTLLDEPVQKTAIKMRNNSTVRSVSKYITNSGGIDEAYALTAIGAYGFIFKNVKMQTTTLLATQAYLTSGAMESVIKFIAGRQRPNFDDPTRSDAEPTFHGPFFKSANGSHLSSSFPSGHTTVAFAAATVFAMEYKNTPWVPIVSYGAASLIGASRITENKHWFTDVFAGATLGYLCGRQVVNNYHRYAKIKADKKRTSLILNMNYYNGTLMPGLTYNF